MKVYFVFFISGIAGIPFSVFNSTDLEIPELFIPELFNLTEPDGMNEMVGDEIPELFIPELLNLTEPDGMNEMAGGDDAYEWLTNNKLNKKRMKTRMKEQKKTQMKNDNLNHPNNDCMYPDIIVHAGDIIDGISINDGGFYRLFGNDGGSPYCINLGDDEFVTGIMFGFHTHRYWATWSGGSRNIDRGHLCGLRIYTNQNIFGPFASWHNQCGKLGYVPNSMFQFKVPIQTTLESFLQTNSTISAKGMLVIKT